MSLYRFKSRETGDLVMLAAHGKRVLEILGKDITKGIIQPDEMANAVVAILQAADAEAALHKRLREEALAAGDPPPDIDPVTLRVRSAPLVEMLKRCEAANVEIVWGV